MSTPARPKQLLPLASDQSLIEDTIERARTLAPPERMRILAGEHLAAPFKARVPGLTDAQFLIEPAARGTAPVLAYAAHHALRHDPDAVLVSLHADHLIDPAEEFTDLLRAAVDIASRERLLLTIGVPPTRPETGYGYLQPGSPCGSSGRHEARRVDAFHEKPDAVTAEAYLRDGYLWNTGIFIWRADVFLEEVRAHAPEVSRALDQLDAGDVDGFFNDVRSVTVDVAVLERSSRVAALPCTFEWDDVGSWASMVRTGREDAEGNVRIGEVHVVDGSGNVAVGEGGPVVLYGVDNLVVVRTKGVSFVTTLAKAPELKALLADLPDHLQAPEV